MRVDADTSPDLLTQVLEDLDFDVACQTATLRYLVLFGKKIPLEKVTSCDKPATVIVSCKCCPASTYACAEHHAALIGALVVTCMRCGTEGAPLMLFGIVPLGDVQ